MVHGEAVLEAVRPARVLGHVATDRTHLLARWIGRVVVAEGGHLLRDLQIGDARLHGDAPVRDVDLEDTIEPGEANHDTARNRQRSTRQPRPVSARDEWQAFLDAQPHECLHLCRRPRQHDERRRFAQMRKRVALVGEELNRLVEDRVRAGNALELLDETSIHEWAMVHSVASYVRW